jgi:hypothetical protein
MYGWMDGCIYGFMYGGMYGWMDGMDGWMYANTHTLWVPSGRFEQELLFS